MKIRMYLYEEATHACHKRQKPLLVCLQAQLKYPLFYKVKREFIPELLPSNNND